MANERLCTIEGCQRKHRARGWCATHWDHWNKWGDPLAGPWQPQRSLSIEDRFWSKVDKTDNCWLWIEGLNEYGYGRFSFGQGHVLAHRFAYKMLYGEMPKTGLDHNCHDRRCVRIDPQHVRPATQKQNLENRRGPNRNTTSGIRGVHWVSSRKRWVANVMHYGRTYFVGYFSDLKEAEAAVIAERNRLFTHNSLDRA